MTIAPIPSNEEERLRSLLNLGLLDTPAEDRFDRITNLAATIFNLPISTLTLIDAEREWFKSVCGLDQKQGERAISFCGHALLSDKIFIIEDTTLDERFKDNPMVMGEPYIRFYAGVPIYSADHQRVGVFCVKGLQPRKFSEQDKSILISLGKWAQLEINSQNLSLAIQKQHQLFKELELFFDLSQDLMCVANAEGFFEKINPAFLRLLGFQKSDLLGQPFADFVYPEDRDSTKAALEQLKRGQTLVNFVNRYVTASGNHIWFQWNATPYDGKFYAVARDTTDSKNKELQLEERTKTAETLNRVAVDRELKMIELKEQITELKAKLNAHNLE
jgi:PAS domain S-box-containing protein